VFGAESTLFKAEKFAAAAHFYVTPLGNTSFYTGQFIFFNVMAPKPDCIGDQFFLMNPPLISPQGCQFFNEKDPKKLARVKKKQLYSTQSILCSYMYP
jgi:hypothetical protein